MAREDYSHITRPRLRRDYIYGTNAYMADFWQYPKALYDHVNFPSISCLSDSAKMLYVMLLSRVSLSLKNDWIDDFGRVYIIFTQEEVCELFNCHSGKAAALFQELDETTQRNRTSKGINANKDRSTQGVGLIQRKRQGQGKPTLIYVKDYLTFSVQYDSAQEADDYYSFREPAQEMLQSHFQKCENRISRNSDIAFPELRKSHAIYNNTTNTDLRDEKDRLDTPSPAEPAHENQSPSISSKNSDLQPRLENWDTEDSDQASKPVDPQIEDLLSNKIALLDSTATLLTDRQRKIYESLCCFVEDTLTMPREKYQINGAARSYEQVKTRLMKLNASSMLEVVKAISELKKPVANMAAYQLTALYNAPALTSVWPGIEESQTSPADTDQLFIEEAAPSSAPSESETDKDPSPAKKVSDYEAEFAEVWELYPVKQGRQIALKAYIKARKAGVERKTIEDGIGAYLAHIKRKNIKKEYIKHGSTWFNQQCWNDVYDDSEYKPTTKDIAGSFDYSDYMKYTL